MRLEDLALKRVNLTNVLVRRVSKFAPNPQIDATEDHITSLRLAYHASISDTPELLARN